MYRFHEKAGTSGEGLNTGKKPDEIEIIFSETSRLQNTDHGKNNFLKIAVGDKVIHAKVFQPFTGECTQLYFIEENNHSP